MEVVELHWLSRYILIAMIVPLCQEAAAAGWILPVISNRDELSKGKARHTSCT